MTSPFMTGGLMAAGLSDRAPAGRGPRTAFWLANRAGVRRLRPISRSVSALLASLLAAVFLSVPATPTALAAGAPPSNRVGVVLSALEHNNESLRTTYGPVWSTGLVYEHCFPAGGGVTMGMSYTRQHGDPYD